METLKEILWSLTQGVIGGLIGGAIATAFIIYFDKS